MAKVYDTATDLITFARSSSGTALRRVGYGDELLVDGSGNWIGDFDVAADLDGWSDPNSNWTFSNQTALCGGGTGKLIGPDTFTTGTIYRLAITVSGRTTGQVRFQFGSTNLDNMTANGTYEFVVVYDPGTNANLRVQPVGGFDGAVDNISVKEVFFDRATDPLVLLNHPDDTPRIEYGSDGSLKGLLIEEQRTNLVTYSAPSTNGNLLTTRASLVTATGVSAPDGSTAIKLQEDGTAGQSHDLGTGNIMSASTTYTLSIFAKAAERDFVVLNIYSGATSYWTWFDLSTGNKGTETNSPVAADIQPIGNGWYRCSLTVTTASTGLPNTRIYISPSNGVLTYDGDGTSGVYVYGAQLEEGSFATSYIPTSGSQQTRSADLASIPVTAFGYNQQAGTVVVEFDLVGVSPNGPTGYPRVWEVDQANENYIAVHSKSFPSTATFRENESQTALNHSEPLTENTMAVIAATFTDDDLATSLDGATALTATPSYTLDLPTALVIGSKVGGGRFLNGHIKSIQYYPRRLTDAQLQELTA